MKVTRDYPPRPLQTVHNLSWGTVFQLDTKALPRALWSETVFMRVDPVLGWAISLLTGRDLHTLAHSEGLLASELKVSTVYPNAEVVLHEGD